MSRKIGIILPPPELRSIVDKTASFVARNGPEFENRIQENERSNPKFCFLQYNDPYRPYYDSKVLEFKSESAEPARQNEKEHEQERDRETQKEREREKQTTMAKDAVPMEAVPVAEPLHFLPANALTLTALDLDIVQLVALFSAKNGRHFLSPLMEREARNPLFDFLKSYHPLYPFYSELVVQYKKTIEGTFRLDAPRAKFEVLRSASQRAEYNNYKKQKDQAEREAAEREKALFDSIDWHDFVVVEALDLPSVPDMDLKLPPPITLESLKAAPDYHLSGAGQEPTASCQEAPEGGDMDMETEMEIEERDDEAGSPLKAITTPTPTAASLPILPKKEQYIPRALAQQAEPLVQICPICHAKVPASSLEEHMRVELLDPKWKEQKAAYLEKHKETNIVSNEAVVKNLQSLAKKRTDIFGKEEAASPDLSALAAPAIALPILPPVVWDGTAASAASTRAAATAASYYSMVATNQANSIAASAAFAAASAPSTGQASTLPAPFVYPAVFPYAQFASPPLPVPAPAPSCLSPMSAPTTMLPAGQAAPEAPGPEAKRLRLDHEPSDTVVIHIALPLGEGSELKTGGQTQLSFTLPKATTTIQALKDLISKETGLPASRQKLYDPERSAYPKNPQTLFEAGLVAETSLVLSFKERGGR